jgi:hypothetical protein
MEQTHEGYCDAPLPTLSSYKDWNSLAGIEEKALGTLLVGNSRPIVGRQARQHFNLQGGESRPVRGLRGRYSFLSRSLYAISLSHKSCPLIHFFQARKRATSGHLQFAGFRSFRAKDHERGSRHRASAAGSHLRGANFPEMIRTNVY